MHLLEMSDANSFLDLSRSHLMNAEAENNLLLSSAWTLARSSAVRSAKLSFFNCVSGNQVVGSALNATERRLLISQTSDEAATFMGREMARRGTRLRGILGPVSSAEAFGRAYALEADQPMRPRLWQRILKLDSPVADSLVPQCPGLARLAKEKDHRQLLQWSLKFVAECGLDERAEETKEVIRRYLENKQLYVWENQGIVAMAGWGGLTPNGVRVNMVYTDPSARGRGYASTLVHYLGRKLFSEGHRFCFLFTDARNLSANRIYERLGYGAVGDFIELRPVTSVDDELK